MNINCNRALEDIEISWEYGNGCETGKNSKKDNGEMKDEMKRQDKRVRFYLGKRDNFLSDLVQHSKCLGSGHSSENPIFTLFLLSTTLLLTPSQGSIMILFISHILTSGFYRIGVKLNLIFSRRLRL